VVGISRFRTRRANRRSLYFIEHYDSNGSLVFSTHGLPYKKALWIIGGFEGVPEEALDIQLRWMAPDDHAGIAWLLERPHRAPGALTVIFRGPFPPYFGPKAADRPPPHEVHAWDGYNPWATKCRLRDWPPGPGAPPTADLPPPLSDAEFEKSMAGWRSKAR
jgi:hypothetical protein